jgi:carbonic anhydrase
MASESHHEEHHWDYVGTYSPEHWGEVDEKSFMCGVGRNQSPINITKSVEVHGDLEPIGFKYVSKAKDVVNNGHTIQVNIDNGSTITVDGMEFELKQFHFHTPSENQIEGKSFPLEAHFVHAAKDGSLAVLAVMFDDGAENPILKKVWDAMPHKIGGHAHITLDAKDLNDFLPAKKEYFRFEGSLTTPPCTEGVRWFVLKNHDYASKEQVAQFLKVLHHHNNRPVQSIGARKVIY